MLLSLCFGTLCQNPSRDREKGFVPGVPYAASDVESINLTNGNLTFSFPLASLPPDRGTATGGLFLRYNSKIWGKHIENIPLQNGQTSRQSFLNQDNRGGWNFGTTYSLRVTRRDDGLDEPIQVCDNGPNFAGVYKWRVQIEFPDGSVHDFRPKGYSNISPFSPTNGNATGPYFNVSPSGVIESLSWSTTGGPYSCSYLTGQDPNPYMTYYSSDGSYMRLAIYSYGGTESPSWELSMPDGSRVTQNVADGQRVWDRNGNYVRYGTVVLPDGSGGVGWIDQLGRYVARKSTSSTEDTIYKTGVGGQMTTTKVRWKVVTVIKKYRTDCADCDHERGQNSWQVVHARFRVVDNIETPTGLVSTFDYHAHNGAVDLNPGGGTTNQPWSPGWGEVKSLTLPSSAKTEYSFEIYEDPEVTDTNYITPTDILDWSGRTTQKTVLYDEEYDGITIPRQAKWLYSTDVTGGSVQGPDGGLTSQAFYHLDNNEELGGYVYRSSTPDGTVTEKLWQFNNPAGFNPGKPVNPYVKTEYQTVPDAAGNPSLTAVRDFTYDKNGNVIEVAEYDWVAYSSIPRDQFGIVSGLPGGLALKRLTKTAFLNPTPVATNTTTTSTNSYWNSAAPRLRSLAAEVEVQDGPGAPRSRSELAYDFVNYDAGNTKGGNLVETKTWDSYKGGQTRAYSNPLTSTNAITTSATYNSYGMPLTTTDANGNVTQITYGNVAGPSGNVTDLYPTQTVAAYGTSIARTSAAVYDFYTGLVTTATDVDNNVSVVTEYDALGRPTKVRSAAGTPLEAWTTTTYDDINRMVIVRSDLETKGDGKKVATQFYDQLGRVRLAKTLEDASTQSATNETDGIKVQTRYKTILGYTYQLTSNPFRASSATSETDPTMGWTLATAWSDGKRSEIQTFSGAGLPSAFGGSNSNSTGIVRTDIDADRVLVTDQAGKQRISKTNALGQLKDVWEIMSASDSATESVTFPNTSIAYGYKTSYSYDTLNNLTTVNQGVQTRSFTYSSLSRLLSATNPESGSISYRYDSNGNLTNKVDARNITTSYAYDALNRVTQRTYSGESGYTTPTVSYFYDNLPNAKGKLTKVSSSVSTTEYTAFDILGRVTAHRQTTDGTAYTTGYIYNLGGVMIEQTYPSGRVVKHVLDNNGALETVKSKKNANAGFFDYAKNFTYNAAGAVTSMQLGNGRWESTQFNSRLQPTQIALGTVQNGTDKLKLNYEYGASAAANNGNVTKQTITVPGLAQPFIQTYAYDELNRLASATETNNGSQTWNQVFGYDRYGNRNITSGLGVTNLTFNAANNKITTSGYSYDSVGNTTSDPSGKTFTYDAENKQKTAVVNGYTNEYFYDGDGKRVKKVVPSSGETTVFVYDATGKLVAEYSTIVASAQDAKVAYLTNDHLGSPRINTDATGAVTARHDYHPFGEEIDGSGGRTTGLGYQADGVRKQFTGYENDSESGLDYAQARMFSANIGRFHSTDPENYGAYEDDPQSWNAYAYTRNNPLLLTDPEGREYVICEPDGKNCKTYSDRDVISFKNDPSVGSFVGGFNEAGLYQGVLIEPVSGKVSGTVVQTSIDNPIRQMLVGGRPVAEGAQTPLTILATIMSFFTTGGSASVAQYAIAPATKAVPSAAGAGAAATTSQVVVQVSKGNLKHIAKHLDEFKKLDPSMTVEKMVELGQKIVAKGVNNSARMSNSTFTEVVKIGGREVTVKVVLNSKGGLRSVYPLP